VLGLGYVRELLGSPVRVAVSCAAVMFCVLGMCASEAAAFGGEGVGAGEFVEPSGVAVDQEQGEVFVVDRNNQRVDVFARSGAFLRAWGWGVFDGAAEPQTCSAQCTPGLEGEGAGQFNFPEGVAVDNDPLSSSHGDVYVADLRSHRVEKFAPSGEFLLMFGKEVNAGTHGDICVAGEVCQAGREGAGPGEFESTSGTMIAVGDTGTVYVGDHERVQEFSPAGKLEREVALAGVGSIAALAVDAGGNLYVRGTELPGVHKYNGSGEELGEPRDAEGEAGALALGPGEELFVVDDTGGVHHILGYDSSGKQISSFDAGASPESTFRGIAFDEAIQSLYVLDRTEIRVVPVPPPGPLIERESSEEVLATTARLNALINPEGPESTDYHFEYGTTTAYGSSTTPTELTGGPFEDQGASAELNGLQPSTLYHFRVVATNAANETTFGADETFTTLPPVVIEGESASQVSATTARLEAQLNPLGLPTTFHFEYGPSAAYGSSAPVPDASAGSGSEPTSVDVLVQGLTPSTTYHYRVVAHNALGTVEGPDRTFTTHGAEATTLIDGRAWEMVSPVDKQGVSFEGIAREGADIQAAADGSAITYAAKAPITSEPQGNRSIANSQVLSHRTAAGSWSSQDIATSHEQVAGIHAGFLSEYRLFSDSLATGVVEPEGATPLSEQATERTPYRREADGEYTPLVTPADVPPGTKFGGEERGLSNFVGGVHFVTATPDQSHALLRSPQGLTPEVEASEQENVFEWADGALRLVSFLPNEHPATAEGFSANVGLGGRNVRGAISDDGNRVVFEAGTPTGSHLYVRDMALGKTVQVDAPEGSFTPSSGKPVFQLANRDVTRVLFLDAGRLTADSTAREEQPDLYMCEVTAAKGALSCALKDLTVDKNPGESAHVLGTVLGADAEGRYVYFVANGALAGGAVKGQCPETAGGPLPEASTSCNLYVRDTVAQTTHLIGVLSGRDRNSWESIVGDLGLVASRVSPNGRYLAFMSQRPLTGFDNRDAVSGVRDEEVFEYDRTSATLVCVSCAGSGARPEGVFDKGGFPGLLVDRPDLWEGQWLAGSIPGWTRVDVQHALYQSRYLSDSGRLFFNSATPLVRTDGNSLEDVYEYEPSEAGGCSLATGCVGLISSGQSSEESAFLDAGADGSDVFFLTAARLLGTDLDNAYDVYDAHVCSTAVPCAAPSSSPPPPCGTTDACRAAPPPQSDIFGPAASQTFSGAGNLKPAPVAKKPLTRAQKLANALKSCRKKKNKRLRVACERQARKKYGSKTKKKARGKKKGRRK
jgi:DNA-binding beta-propeller fold protein YncE